MNILVTGASGYIGRCLVPRLRQDGHQVSCLVRKPERLIFRAQDEVVIRQGDLLDPASLQEAFKDIEVAFYLVHSMADGVRGYIGRDLQAARNFGETARAAGVRRIIYLGGLGECDKAISPHLEARQHVGELLRESGVPVTELRAAIVIGSGSMSFEMIRYLTERLPILPTPAWITTLCQPIAIENVLDYLVRCLSEPRSIGAIFEIGGPDVLTYADIMRGYAAARRLKRRLVRLPFLTTQMLALGANVVTPLPSPYLHILIEGLRSEVVVRDPSAQRVFALELIPYRQAIQKALGRDGSGEVEAFWEGVGASAKPGRTSKIREGMYIEQIRLESNADPEALFSSFASLGGRAGWYYANLLWQIRGLIDRLAGGVGIRRGRRSEADLREGDVLGGYRVEKVDMGRMVRLRNEMKAPGPAWMQFEASRSDAGRSLYTQTAFFEPHGLAGLAYWWGLYPFHQLIFNGMAKAIVRNAEEAGF